MTASTRRQFLTTCLGAGAAALAGPTPAAAKAATGPKGFRYCLNTSTIMGQKLGIVEEIEIAARAGYQSVEVWVRAIEAYLQQGGSIGELRRRLADLGLTVEGAITFFPWIVDDADQRVKGLDQARREMDLLAQIGCARVAAPPVGATKGASLDPFIMAQRYRALLDLGDKTGVVPVLELWGASQNLHRLGECALVAIEAGHPKACLLPDVYHIYKGGSDFAGLRLLGAQAVPILHLNDYPANPPRETITDRDRIFPGDGVAPLKQILNDLKRVNPDLVLSVELFNPAYWERDALEVAKTALAKMKRAVEQAEID